MKTIRKTVIILVLILSMVLTGFSQTNQMMKDMKASNESPSKAICILYPTKGNNVSGTITFIAMDKGVKVVADVSGLTKGKHGFHIHEYGDCNSPDGLSAGGHFNPGKMEHGGPMDMSRHEGDMGNLEADESGKAHLEYIDTAISLTGSNSIIGRSVILHRNEDDLKSQPAGNAGARIACGVIGIAK